MKLNYDNEVKDKCRGYAACYMVKSYSWSQNQISTEVEAKFNMSLLIELT